MTIPDEFDELPDGHLERKDEFDGCWIPCLILLISFVVVIIWGIIIPLIKILWR